MLNAQGRVICDMLIYRTPHTRYECQFTPPGQAKEPDELYIECEASQASGLANTLYGYRVRRKIALEIQENHSIWCLFPNLMNLQPNQLSIGTNSLEKEHKLVTISTEIINPEMIAVTDPRLDMMGIRILAADGNFDTIKDKLQSSIDADIHKASLKDYITHRYRLGVGEGIEDHPEGSCFPLECNADFLGSVSFDKGCYLGQELTARIYHTGVVRKRLMPVVLNLEGGQLTPMEGSEIVNEEGGKRVGSIRKTVRRHALALLRKDLITESTSLIVRNTNTKITTWVPFWWRPKRQQQRQQQLDSPAGA